MGALSPEERAKLRAVADMIPDLPELRQAQKCKVAISVLFHVLRHAGGGPDPYGRCQSHLSALCPHGRMALCLPDNGHTGDGSDACLPGLR